MNDRWDIFHQAEELSRRGEEFALATVVWRQGPSSGQPGARALITTAGQLYGWIGGACAEPVVVREAQREIAERTAKLLLLGSADQFGGSVPEGMVPVAISCQSEGAMQIYIEPVVPTPHLTIVGRSPMVQTLADLARALGWRADVCDGPDLSAADLSTRSVVIVATQGHGDEEAIERAVSAFPAFVGLVASRKRAEAVLGYLADRGVPRNLLDRVHAPVGLDLGHTTHREIAVAVLKRGDAVAVEEPGYQRAVGVFRNSRRAREFWDAGECHVHRCPAPCAIFPRADRGLSGAAVRGVQRSDEIERRVSRER